MKNLKVNELKEVNGGVLPFFVVAAVYGEIACFSAIVSGMATYKAIKGD